MAGLQRGRDAISIQVKADIDRSSFAGALAAEKALGGSEDFKIKADVDASSFARARAGIAVLTKESNKLGDVFNRSNLSIGQWTGILAAASPIILDVAGALGALTASLGAATAGLGALGAGFASAGVVGFGGIASIAAPAISSLKDLMTAQTAADKSRATGAQSAARSQAAAAQQIKTATEAVTTAEGQLKVAQETETTAQKALTLARQDAVRQLEDMRRAAIEGATSEKRARLSIQQAEANLRQLRASGTASALDIKDAELSIVEARQNAKDVSLQAKRAQEDFNRAQRKGLDQMPGVVSAQQSLDDATRSVATAQRDVAKATQNLAFQQKQANTATQAGGTSMAALALAQKKAGPAAVKFAANLKDFTKQWRSLTEAGRTDFFSLLNDGLTRVNARMPLFAKSAISSVRAAREAFDAFWAKAAAGPEFKKFITTMTDTFAKAIVPVGDAFGNIAKVVERLAVAVAPDIVRMAKGFDDITQGWVDSTGNAKSLRETIHGLVDQTVTWLKLIQAAGDLIVAVLVPGMGQGKMAVEGITASLQEWTRWVNAHPKEMRDFFKQGLETTKQLAQVLLGFLPALFQISQATRPIARAFLAILKGLNSLKVGNVSALTVLLGAMVGAKLVRGLTGLIGTFGRLRTAALGAATAERAAATVPLGVGTSATTATGRTIGSTGTVAAGGRFARTKAVARGIGGAAIGTAVVSGIIDAFDDKGLQRSFGMKLQDFFHGATFGLVQGSEEAASKASQAIADVISRIRPGGTIPEDAANIAVASGKIKGLTDATLALVRVRSQLLPQLVREGSLTQDQADALAAYTKQQQKVLANAKDFTTGRRKGLGFAEALAEDKKLIGPHIASILRQLGRLSPGARKEASDTMIGMAKVLEDKGKLPAGSAETLRKTIGESWHGMRLQGVKESGKMAKGIAINAGALVSAVTAGLDILKGNVKKSLKAFGVKALNFTLTKPGKAGDLLGSVVGAFGAQKGAMVVPGHGSGDKVPVRAMVESGEVLAVLNRNAAKAWMKWNEKFPRFRGGGLVDRRGVSHFAKGGAIPGDSAGLQPAIAALMRKLIGAFGGSVFSGVRPGDSGFHGRGMAADWIGGDWAGASKYANKIGSQLLEGIYWPIDHGGSQVSWDTGKQVPTSFWGSDWPPHRTHIHFAVGDMVKGAATAIKKLARIILKGPEGALKDMGQGALDKTWKAANAYLAEQTPTGVFDTGPVGKVKGTYDKAQLISLWNATGGDGSAGLMAAIALAESSGNPRAVNPIGGGDPTGLWQIRPSPVHPVAQSALFDPKTNAEWAHRILSSEGLAAWEVYTTGAYRKFLKKGGLVAPYVGKFHDGGFVGQDGLASVQRGELVLPGLQKGGSVAPTFPRDLIRGLRHLVHFTPEDSRKERRQEARLLRRIARTDGVKQLNLISKALGKYGVDFTKAEEKRLRKLSRDQAHGGGLTEEQHRELRGLRQESRQAGGQKDIREQIAVQREMIAEFKEYQRDAKERNRLLREIRANEKGGMRAVSNYIASDIGFSQRQKARQASAGNVARY